MTTAATVLGEVATHDLVEEIARRQQERIAISVLRSRIPWRRRFQLGPHVWGISSNWLAVCPWNGAESWISVPLLTLIVGVEHVELVLGHGKWTINFDIRWRWS